MTRLRRQTNQAEGNHNSPMLGDDHEDFFNSIGQNENLPHSGYVSFRQLWTWHTRGLEDFDQRWKTTFATKTATSGLAVTSERPCRCCGAENAAALMRTAKSDRFVGSFGLLSSSW